MARSMLAAMTLVACGLSLNVPSAASARQRSFTLTPVGPNVWAAIGGTNADTGANAGFVVGDDGVAVIDTFASATGAAQLLAEIRRLTSLPIRFVVNTHHHLDHVAGNAVFVEAGAVVLAHRNVHRWIRLENLRLLETAGAAAPPELRAAIERVASPRMGYAGELQLHLGSRVVQVREMSGHTGGDSVVTIPDAGVVFTGDLFWHRGLPNMIDGTTDSWIETLDSLAAAGQEHTFVPGHGGLARMEDVTAFRDYLATLRRAVSEARARQLSGQALADAVKSLLAKAYSEWAFFDYLSVPNILHMEQELNGTKRVPR